MDLAIVLWVGQEGVDTGWMLEYEKWSPWLATGVAELRYRYGRPTILLPHFQKHPNEEA